MEKTKKQITVSTLNQKFYGKKNPTLSLSLTHCSMQRFHSWRNKQLQPDAKFLSCETRTRQNKSVLLPQGALPEDPAGLNK